MRSIGTSSLHESSRSFGARYFVISCSKSPSDLVISPLRVLEWPLIISKMFWISWLVMVRSLIVSRRLLFGMDPRPFALHAPAASEVKLRVLMPRHVPRHVPPSTSVSRHNALCLRLHKTPSTSSLLVYSLLQRFSTNY